VPCLFDRRGEAGIVAQPDLRLGLPLSFLCLAARVISALPRAAKRVMRAARVWIPAVWRSGSREAMRSPKLLRQSIFASIRLRAWYPVSRVQRARPKRRVARKVLFLARAAGPSSFRARPLRRMGMMAVPPRPAMVV
jgi:hypothetical protein